jgi:hypothetical protein
VAGATALQRAAQPAQTILDNTDGSLEINLNVLINDASISADAQAATADGYIVLSYIVLGDD